MAGDTEEELFTVTMCESDVRGGCSNIALLSLAVDHCLEHQDSHVRSEEVVKLAHVKLHNRW